MSGCWWIITTFFSWWFPCMTLCALANSLPGILESSIDKHYSEYKSWDYFVLSSARNDDISPFWVWILRQHTFHRDTSKEFFPRRIWQVNAHIPRRHLDFIKSTSVSPRIDAGSTCLLWSYFSSKYIAIAKFPASLMLKSYSFHDEGKIVPKSPYCCRPAIPRDIFQMHFALHKNRP